MGEMKLYDQLLERGRVSAGNSEDLERFRNKLKNKEAITYAAIGGSITQGAAASAPRVTAFAPLFASWLQQHTECRFINGGGGSNNKYVWGIPLSAGDSERVTRYHYR